MEATLDPEATRARLRDWLATRLGRADVALGPLEVPAHGGLSHETLLVEAAWDEGGREQRRGLVARVAPAGTVLFPEHDLEREYRLLAALRTATDVPVPRVRWWEPDPAVLGRPFYVMDRVPGRVPSDFPPYQLGGWLHDASPDEQGRALAAAVDALAELHRVEPSALGADVADRLAGGTATASSGLDRELATWRRYLDWAEADGPLPVLEAAYAWCVEHRPVDPAPDAVCWGDARLGNVLFDGGYGVAALLDWEMATLAPPELDVGWFLFVHETALLWLDDLPGFADRAGILARYATGLGRAPADLRFWEVWAGLRAAAIQARIVQRQWERGEVAGAGGREDTPVVTSLRRLVDLDLPP